MRSQAVLFARCLACLLAIACFGSTADLGLVEAARNQNKNLVRALLQQRVDVNTTEADGATALHWAVHWDDLETADRLIRAGANSNAANDFGVTPLSLACANANTAMVRRLLQAGANPNAAASTGESALMTAARTGNVDVVKALLAKGADANAREKARNQTALMWAVAEQHPEIVRLLAGHGADLHARSRVVREFAIRDRGQAKRKPPVQTIEGGGSTPLLFAARLGSVDSAGILLDAGANVNDTAPDGTSALVMAAYSRHAALAAYLLDRGADPNAGGAGYTALHIAVLTGDLKLVKALLVHGADPNARLTKGTPVTRFGAELVLAQSLAGATPLLLAAGFSEADMMRILRAAGADPRLTMNDGTTLLMAAAGPDRRGKATKGASDARAENRALEAVKIALELGSDASATNKSGETALRIAASRKLTTIVQLLVDRGAK